MSVLSFLIDNGWKTIPRMKAAEDVIDVDTLIDKVFPNYKMLDTAIFHWALSEREKSIGTENCNEVISYTTAISSNLKQYDVRTRPHKLLDEQSLKNKKFLCNLNSSQGTWKSKARFLLLFFSLPNELISQKKMRRLGQTTFEVVEWRNTQKSSCYRVGN